MISTNINTQKSFREGGGDKSWRICPGANAIRVLAAGIAGLTIRSTDPSTARREGRSEPLGFTSDRRSVIEITPQSTDRRNDFPSPPPQRERSGPAPGPYSRASIPRNRERPSGLANLGPAGQSEERDEAERMIGPGDHPRGPFGLDKQHRLPVDPDAPHLGTVALGRERGQGRRPCARNDSPEWKCGSKSSTPSRWGRREEVAADCHSGMAWVAKRPGRRQVRLNRTVGFGRVEVFAHDRQSRTGPPHGHPACDKFVDRLGDRRPTP